jgi:hypothetical protein
MILHAKKVKQQHKGVASISNGSLTQNASHADDAPKTKKELEFLIVATSLTILGRNLQDYYSKL